jgi:hypothetical protein
MAEESEGYRGHVVRLPPGAEQPTRVFVNGVRQVEGVDYTVRRGALHFTRELARERVGFWRWTAMFLALFGSYGRNDTVDVHYRAGGRAQVAAGLQIEPAGDAG